MRLLNPIYLIPDLIVDMRYATTNNFTGRRLYDDATPYLDIHAAAALERAARHFRKQHLRLVWWDGYRSPADQQKLLGVMSDPRFVIPVDESLHCTGRAVDVTLADADGKYLDMGTDFDDFTERAYPDADDIDDDAKANRRLLRQGMEAAGFKIWPYEWWHFDLLL